MQNEILEQALKYAEMGWHIFPCQAGQKVPFPGTRGVKEATNDVATIKAWWARWPDANIALACGPDSGVFVVDIDVDKGKGIDGWATLKEIEDELDEVIPLTVSQNSPRGGAHYLFKTDNPPANKNNLHKGIDIRSGGYYIMLAPSVHPNGKKYKWAQGLGPTETEMVEYPDWLRPPKKKLPWDGNPPQTKKEAPSKPKPKPIPRNGDKRVSTITERASLYLAECTPATEGQGGHDALLWAARAMVVGFELSENEALSLLWNDYNPRCNPPWDRQDARDVADFERKVIEAKRSVGLKPSGWLLDEYGLRELPEMDDAALKYASDGVDNLLAELNEPKPAHEPKEKSPKPEPEPVSDDELYHPSGFVGQLAEWITETSLYPQPKYSVLAALIGFGTLLSGKVRDCSDGRTNLYGIAVGHSSAGKDRPSKALQELFLEAGADHLFGGGKVTSDSALETALKVCKVQLFLMDEVGDFFSGIKNASGGNGGTFMATIKPALKELWSCANSMWRGKQRAEGEYFKIYEPQVSAWAVTTPGRLYEGVSAGDLEDGFLPRVLFAISEDRPRATSFPQKSKVPQGLIAEAQAWVNRVIPQSSESGDILSTTNPEPMLVETTPEAMEVFYEFEEYKLQKLAEGEGAEDKTFPLWGKVVENARRIALILACGEDYVQPEINAYHATWAVNYVRRCVTELIASIDVNMSENQFEKDKKRLFTMIKNSRDKGVTKSIITNRTQYLRDKKLRDSYLDELIEGGKVHCKRVKDLRKKSGYGSLRYWAYPYGMTDDD